MVEYAIFALLFHPDRSWNQNNAQKQISLEKTTMRNNRISESASLFVDTSFVDKKKSKAKLQRKNRDMGISKMKRHNINQPKSNVLRRR